MRAHRRRAVFLISLDGSVAADSWKGVSRTPVPPPSGERALWTARCRDRRFRRSAVPFSSRPVLAPSVHWICAGSSRLIRAKRWRGDGPGHSLWSPTPGKNSSLISRWRRARARSWSIASGFVGPAHPRDVTLAARLRHPAATLETAAVPTSPCFAAVSRDARRRSVRCSCRLPALEVARWPAWSPRSSWPAASAARCSCSRRPRGGSSGATTRRPWRSIETTRSGCSPPPSTACARASENARTASASRPPTTP